jgi:putative FmdB family regulatory protein
MPIYEYQCKQCSERHEIIQRFSDPPVETCPKCGGDMKKLFSSPAIQFKGSGFYKTDYASPSSTPSSSSSPSSEKSSDKSETKSDAKSESSSSSSSKSESTATKTESKSESKSSE